MRRPRGHVAWPLALITVGVVVLLDQLDAWPQESRVWPVVLIVLGAWLLLGRLLGPWWASGGLFVPLALVGAGVIGALQDADVITQDVSVWPVVLIALGVAGLIEGMGWRRRAAELRRRFFRDGDDAGIRPGEPPW